MNCPRCERNIPADAAFCIYCATPLKAAPAPETRTPATGATIRLKPAEAPAAPSRPYSPPAQPAWKNRPSRRYSRGYRRQHPDPSGMLFLAGLLFLIATNSFWPGILLLIGLAHYVKQSARGRGGRAIRNIVFWGGLAFLFWAHIFWPVILMLFLASSLFGHRGYAWRP